METESHLFLHCDYAQKVWSLSLFKEHFDPSTCPDFIDALKAGKLPTCIPPLGIVSDVFPYICWFIWLARNQLIFEKRLITPEDTVSKAIWSARKWNMAQPTTRTQHQGINIPLIIPNLDDLMVCCTDAAWKKETNMAALKCIFTNKQGTVISQVSRVEKNVPSPLVA